MNRWVRVFVAVAAVALVTTAAAAAEPVAYKFDKAHSVVGFNVRHFFAKVPGKFKEFDGTFMLDPQNLAASSVDVTIQATSVDTDNERRDTHLRSPDFFEVEKHPVLTFKSTKVVPGEGSKFKVEGDLTIRGITKPVVLDVEHLGTGEVTTGGQSMGTRTGFEATTRIDRKDFGIVWNRALDQGGAMLSDDVWITLQIEAVKDVPKPGGAAGEKKADASK